LPRYDSSQKTHAAIAQFSKACHVARRAEKFQGLRDLAKLDQVVKDVWNLSAPELKACQDALLAFGAAALETGGEADVVNDEE